MTAPRNFAVLCIMESVEMPKRWGTKRECIIFLSLSFLLLVWQEAYAYLDPGSGSMLLQIAVGSGLATLFLLKRLWYRIAIFVSKVILKRKSANSDAEFH